MPAPRRHCERNEVERGNLIKKKITALLFYKIAAPADAGSQ
jgi:hypothetical protein